MPGAFSPIFMWKNAFSITCIKIPSKELLDFWECNYWDVNILHYIHFILQADIVDVNEIFRDLAKMVNEQGDMTGKKATLFIFLQLLHRGTIINNITIINFVEWIIFFTCR